MWTNDIQDPDSNGNSSTIVCQKEFDCVADLVKHMNKFHMDFVVKPPFICRWHGLVIILYVYIDPQGTERFSNELPNFHFMNGRILRNWSNIFIIFLVDFTAH